MHNTDDADTDSSITTDKDNGQDRPILVRSSYGHVYDKYDEAQEIFAK